MIKVGKGDDGKMNEIAKEGEKPEVARVSDGSGAPADIMPRRARPEALSAACYARHRRGWPRKSQRGCGNFHCKKCPQQKRPRAPAEVGFVRPCSHCPKNVNDDKATPKFNCVCINK